MADMQNVPLVVDLDGTLIRTDMMWESLARLLRRNPLALFQIFFWWSRGRARLKQELVARVQIDPATLPYHEPFLTWLRNEKKAGRKLVLATASDIKMAEPIAVHVGVFDEVMGSDGKINLRSENKLRALTEKFGERGFDYAGNSTADFAVWRGSHAAVVVNASPAVLAEAGRCTQLGPVFCEGFSHLAVAKRVCLELFWRSGYLIAMLAGLLLASAFPNLNCAGFAWVVPALMLAAAAGKSGGDSFRAGYVAGLTFWLVSLTWLLLIPVAGYPILGWLALSAYTALFSGAWVWFMNWTQADEAVQDSWSARNVRALSGAAAWVSLEMLRGWLFSGFPWGLLGVSQFKIVPLIQIAAFTGVYGVSFLLSWFSIALFYAGRMILKNPTKRFVWQAEMALPLIAVMGTFIAGFFGQNGEPAAQNSVRVALVQPSVPIITIWNPTPSNDARRFQDLLTQTQQALTNNPEVIVWPESGVPDGNDDIYHAIVQFAVSNHVWIIFNAEDSEVSTKATNYYNAALLLSPEGEMRQIYHKRQLVIFGEYVPLIRWFPFIQWFTPITGGWTPGTRPVQFELDRPKPADELGGKVITVVSTEDKSRPTPRTHFKAAPLICFEDAFPALGRSSTDDDTDFLVNLTNDGWFGPGAEQWQHAALAVFRAVENGRPLARCANNGITCLIDRHGRVTELLTDRNGDVHGQGTLTVDVPLLDEPANAFYHRHGDLFGWACVALTALAAVRRVTGLRPYHAPPKG